MTEHLVTLKAAAIDMLERQDIALRAVHGGGNAGVFKITTDTQDFALKAYPAMTDDGRDRRLTEWRALEFMAANGITNIPLPIATDVAANRSILSWCAGNTVRVDELAIDQAVGFIKQLSMLRTQTAAASLALASEACLSAAELVRQINQRLLRLQRDAIADHNFQAFLSHQLAPRVTRWRADAEAAYDRLNWSFSAPVAAAARTLSPSDFGFHNAIQTADNRLTFIDFEYFGWDDPVKIAADFMLHPGMNLSDDQGQQFCTALTEIFGSSDGPDAAFATRLKILLPLYRLRWCFIILNEFLPDRWQRRQAAGNQQQRQTVLAQQLVKAVKMLDRH